MGLAGIIAEVVALASLLMLSVYDVRYREVPTILAVAGVVAAAALRAVSGLPEPWPLLRLFLLVDGLLIASMALMAWLKLLGWGDVAALATITAASPAPLRNTFPVPLALASLFYYVVLTLLLMLGNLAVNLAMYREELRRLPPARRLLYALIARPRKAEEILKKPGWWYPLGLCGEGGLRIDIYLDPPDIARKVKEAIESGCIKPSSTIWTTYGLPAIPLLTAGYIIALLLGLPLHLV